MAFRQAKSDSHREQKTWNEWIEKNRAALVAMGLPPEVMVDASCWSDFLENGHLHWHPSSGFDFHQLTHHQLVLLRDFLEKDALKDRAPTLLRWLRTRNLGQS
ncbi:hypothetical protein [Planctomyces sp. SH-PL14]|uniref:hypothetical protein n=1 Tax=Planctomyces sp. SH-PL14 TaxID=1632864 RepID=UPI00078D09F3|nr:hypothetical protein [Planctomyces sp. SH-PL14]AMV20367.1 hypothetical protein VT03_20890 [Planctomyces sp. SH-PL14]